jgi:uncharacterized membrane protein
MATIWKYVRTTLIGGLLFLLPIVVILLVLQKAFEFALKLLVPLEKALPGWFAIGSAAPHFTAAMLLLVICFLAGLVAGTGAGGWLRRALERTVLGRVPGYTMLRSMFSGGAPVDKPIEVALVEMENMLVIAYVMERHANGYVTLFVPSAPMPNAGSVFFARSEQVRIIDVAMGDTLLCIVKLGLGAEKMLKGVLDQPSKQIEAR